MQSGKIEIMQRSLDITHTHRFASASFLNLYSKPTLIMPIEILQVPSHNPYIHYSMTILYPHIHIHETHISIRASGLSVCNFVTSF